MTENEETQTRISYSKKLSDYFYPKLNTISNENTISEEDDFTASELSEYDLDESDGKIDISSTKKLIKYLKGFVEVNVKKLDSKIDTKLDSSDYVIDNQLSGSSPNPVANSVLYNQISSINSLLNSKANLRHTHTMSDITSLSANLDTKANASDLSSHTTNTSNPHGVTLSQLGFNDTGWDNFPITASSWTGVGDFECRKYGKIVSLRIVVTAYKTFAKNSTIFTLKTQFRPNHTVHTYGYISGNPVPVAINSNGNVVIGGELGNNKGLRIYECYFGS